MSRKKEQPQLYTSFSPALIHLYEVSSSIVVIIDVLRATSTIATALYNGAKSVIPVDSVADCISLGKKIEAITAGERDGQIAEGLQYGNSPFEYPRSFVSGRTLVLTTTNGTKLLHMALDNGASGIVTGSFVNISALCDYLKVQDQNVILGCAAWKDRVNMEDMLMAGAIISRIGGNYSINCDSSQIAATLYREAQGDLFEFMKARNASHYQRLMGFGLEKDIRYCLTEDMANIVPVYRNGMLIAETPGRP